MPELHFVQIKLISFSPNNISLWETSCNSLCFYIQAFKAPVTPNGDPTAFVYSVLKTCQRAVGTPQNTTKHIKFASYSVYTTPSQRPYSVFIAGAYPGIRTYACAYNRSEKSKSVKRLNMQYNLKAKGGMHTFESIDIKFEHVRLRHNGLYLINTNNFHWCQTADFFDAQFARDTGSYNTILIMSVKKMLNLMYECLALQTDT